MKRAIIFLAMILTFGFTQGQSFQFKGAKGYGMKVTDSTLVMSSPQGGVETPIIMITPVNMDSGGSFIVEAVNGSKSKYVMYRVKNKWYMTMTFIDGFTGATSTTEIQLIPN